MRNEWHRQLRREASVHHMCAENRDALESVDNIHDAIGLYKKTINWALEECYPTIETLRKYFSDCEIDGIFIDKHFEGEILDIHKVYVFHNCTGAIRTGLNLERKIIPMLYFANGCDMEVLGIEDAPSCPKVPIYIFGSNSVKAEDSNTISFSIHNFNLK